MRERRIKFFQSWIKMIQSYIKHFKYSSLIGKLIKGTKFGDELYWYNLKLKDALGWRGILKFIRFALLSRKSDEVAGNYNVSRLYYGEAIGDGLNKTGATVWNYTSLKNPPIIESDEICKILEYHANEIIQEYAQNIDKFESHPDNDSLAKNGSWSGIFLFGVDGIPKYETYFPATYKILQQLPISKNFGFVMISKLSPGVKILPHCGSSNLRFRYHLGLIASEPDDVKIRVGKEWISWQTGKAFGFDDSYEHEVHHNGKEDRVVLVVDTWNPSLTNGEIDLFNNPVFHEFGSR